MHCTLHGGDQQALFQYRGKNVRISYFIRHKRTLTYNKTRGVQNFAFAGRITFIYMKYGRQ